jgi:hypothetical protein
MVSFAKLSLCAVFLMASSVSAFGLPATKTLVKRNQMAKLAMADTPSAEIPRGGEAVTGGGTATIPTEVFNLVKSIAGAGVLSLPAGKCELLCVCVCRPIYAVIVVLLLFYNVPLTLKCITIQPSL